jgi:hypothetical protein
MVSLVCVNHLKQVLDKYIGIARTRTAIVGAIGGRYSVPKGNCSLCAKTAEYEVFYDD